MLVNSTELEIAANSTKDAWQFKGADLDEQVESWQASQSMVVVASMLALGATAIHLLLLLGWWLLHAGRLARPVPQALVFPVVEHTLAGVVAQPMAMAAAVVLLQPCALPGVRVAAAVSMAGLLVYMATIFVVLLAVAKRQHELGLGYIHTQQDRPGAPPSTSVNSSRLAGAAGQADHRPDAASTVQAGPASSIRQLPGDGNISHASSFNLRATAPRLVRSVSTKVLHHVRSASTSLPGMGKAAAGSVAAVLKDSVGHGSWHKPEQEQHQELRTAYQQSGAGALESAICEWSQRVGTFAGRIHRLAGTEEHRSQHQQRLLRCRCTGWLGPFMVPVMRAWRKASGTGGSGSDSSPTRNGVSAPLRGPATVYPASPPDWPQLPDNFYNPLQRLP